MCKLRGERDNLSNLSTEPGNTQCHRRTVLGGNDIHIRSVVESGEEECKTEEKILHSLCIATKSDKRAAESSTNGKSDSLDDNWQERHCSCVWHDGPQGSNKPRLLNLDLLRVSRQIHAEAALLPLQLNTFIFTYTSDMARFADRLMPPQRRSTQSISLLGDVWSLWVPNFRSYMGEIGRFTGLKDITYIVDASGYPPRALLPARQVQQHMKEFQHMFERPHPVETTIRIMPVNELSVELLQAFESSAREMEQALLVPVDVEAREAEKKRKHEERRKTEKEGRERRAGDRERHGLRKVAAKNYGI